MKNIQTKMATTWKKELLKVYREAENFAVINKIEKDNDTIWSELRQKSYEFYKKFQVKWSQIGDTHEDIHKQAKEDLQIHEILINEVPMVKNKTGKWVFTKPSAIIQNLMKKPKEIRQRLGDEMWRAS